MRHIRMLFDDVSEHVSKQAKHSVVVRLRLLAVQQTIVIQAQKLTFHGLIKFFSLYFLYFLLNYFKRKEDT